MTTALYAPAPGLRLGGYPQRFDKEAADGSLTLWLRRWRHRLTSGLAPHRRAAAQIAAQASALAAAHPTGATDWQAETRALVEACRRHGLSAANRLGALALASQVAAVVLQRPPYPVQQMAAHGLVCGVFVEMATGEGKTLSIALAAAALALAGSPVHVVTANDYLVGRDADEMAPFFAALGLSVGRVCEADGPALRRAAYACDVVYVTARELVFDYLRDGLSAPFRRSRLEECADALAGGLDPARRVLRGLCAVIVDEADSVLIDEARLPFILARAAAAQASDEAAWRRVWALALKLEKGRDFSGDAESGIQLSAAGVARAGLAAGRQQVEQARLEQALTALHLFVRDRDYVVRDGQVGIVDQHSGRLADKRAWSRELHRFIELKEGCALGRETETAAQLTFQRFFGRYHFLAGISGTLRECAGELAAVYDLPLMTVPLHSPLRRQLGPSRLFVDHAAMWRACAQRVRELVAANRPVLIGTDSVRDSRALSAELTAHGITHAVLDALQDASEAAIVAQAGQAGRVTVATRMAGRGTDIRLDAAARAAGGLHVISCQHNPTARIDRQLIGRCARQGDPGSAECFRALAAEPLQRSLPAPLRGVLLRHGGRLPAQVADPLFGWLQFNQSQRDKAVRLACWRNEQMTSRQHAYRGFGF